MCKVALLPTIPHQIGSTGILGGELREYTLKYTSCLHLCFILMLGFMIFITFAIHAMQSFKRLLSANG